MNVETELMNVETELNWTESLYFRPFPQNYRNSYLKGPQPKPGHILVSSSAYKKSQPKFHFREL